MLLGDTVELRHGPIRDALAGASRVLGALAAALDGGEIVIVPGNHDHELLAPWLARRAEPGPPPPLGLQAEVSWAAGDPLAALAGALAPAAVRVCYPGVWLREDVYATHGHYGDVHSTVPMFERLGAGVMSRMLGVEQPRVTEDYEAVLAPIYAWIHAVAQAGGPQEGGSENLSTRVWRSVSSDADAGRSEQERRARAARANAPASRAARSSLATDLRAPIARAAARLRRRAGAAGVSAAVGLLNRARIGPLHADLSVSELRRAELLAIGAALCALQVDCSYAILGHTHRAGPLPGDDHAEWVALTGTRLVNTGCWVHEPHFLGRDPRHSPYRSGFCVLLEDERAPRLLNLLDDARRQPPRDGHRDEHSVPGPFPGRPQV